MDCQFFDKFSNLVAGDMLYVLRQDELGNPAPSTFSWSATTSQGALARWGDCNKWKAGDDAFTSSAWVPSRSGTLQEFLVNAKCSRKYPLLCMGVDINAPVTLTPVSGRTAFVTTTSWIPKANPGIDFADELCRKEAEKSGLGGSFLALLSDLGMAASARFDTKGPPWVRKDGVALTKKTADLFSANEWIAALEQQRASGDPQLIWTGAQRITEKGTAETTCNGWLPETQFAIAEANLAYSVQLPRFWGSTDRNCGEAASVICLQE